MQGSLNLDFPSQYLKLENVPLCFIFIVGLVKLTPVHIELFKKLIQEVHPQVHSGLYLQHLFPSFEEMLVYLSS